jgi:phosphate transport system protein
MYQYLEEELDQLKARILKMGSLVEEQISTAIKGLLEGDTSVIQKVSDGDEQVDKYDVKIDKHCQRIFALTQPVAIDLRFIMTALKMNNDLERMGDIAVNIAHKIEPLSNHKDLLLEFKVDEMAAVVQRIVKGSIDSFVNIDTELAVEVIKLDDVVDDFEKSMFDELVNKMKSDPDLIEPCSHILSLSKNLERLADHATNVAEDVIFLTDAKFIKHKKNIDKYAHPPKEDDDLSNDSGDSINSNDDKPSNDNPEK